MPQAALASEAIATVGHTMRALNGEEGARRAAITQGLRGGALAYGMNNKESAWICFRFFPCVLMKLGERVFGRLFKVFVGTSARSGEAAA